jgi:hypothetical protein
MVASAVAVSILIGIAVIATIVQYSMNLSNRDRNLTAAIWAILMSEISDD